MEDWRRKTYYKPRVLIETERILTPQFDELWVCLTGAQVEMLRNLTQYLHRRSTFAEAYDALGYYAPDNDDWSTIQESVADLEEKLMGCEDLIASLNSIARAIKGITGPSSITPGMVEDFIDSGELAYENPAGTTTFEDNARMCDVAELAWLFGYEMLTEVLQPVQDGTSDALMPLAMVAVAAWVGTLALAIPVGLILAVLWAFIETWETGSLQNVINGYITARDDLLCAVYLGLHVDANLAYTLAAEIINDIDGWSPIDKTLGRLMFAPWVLRLMSIAVTNQTNWAVLGVTPAACSSCPSTIQGDDWYAVFINPPVGLLEFAHIPPPGWEDGCYNFNVPAGETFVGFVFDVRFESGDCELVQQDNPGAICTGTTRAWPNSSTVLHDGLYFAVNTASIDEVECKRLLAPSALILETTEEIAGPADGRAGFHFGWSCTGEIDVQFIWAVFEGTAP